MKRTPYFLRYVGAALAFFLVVWLGIFAYTTQNPGTSAAYWKVRIALVGAERAYGELAVSIAGMPLIVQHRRAHRFGEALYAREGVDGAVVCDKRFFYGCFHQLIGEAIAEHGVAVASDLAAVCARALPDVSACFHSIGHGLLNFFGYDEESLNDALQACRTLNDPKAFCSSGVFMEYVLRTMLQPETEALPIESGGRHAVCDSLSNLSSRERLWCIFWLPTWWAANHVSYPAQGLECRRYRAEELSTCIEGIGKMTVFDAKPSPDFTGRACRSATRSQQEYVSCVSAAAYELAFSGYDEAASDMCTLLSVSEEWSLCAQYAAKERMAPRVDR